MKATIITIWALLLASVCLFAQGSLSLNEGDSYTYLFSNLPLRSITTRPVDGPFGSLDVGMDGYDSGERLLVEMFETSASELPISSLIVWVDPNSFPQLPPGNPRLVVNGAWQDLQGAIRLTMVSGSVSIPWFTVTVFLPDQNGFADHELTVACVPEPSSLSFVIVGAVFVLVAQSIKFHTNKVAKSQRDF